MSNFNVDMNLKRLYRGNFPSSCLEPREWDAPGSS